MKFLSTAVHLAVWNWYTSDLWSFSTRQAVPPNRYLLSSSRPGQPEYGFYTLSFPLKLYLHLCAKLNKFVDIAKQMVCQIAYIQAMGEMGRQTKKYMALEID